MSTILNYSLNDDLQKADRLIDRVMYVYFGIGLCLSIFYNTYYFSLVVGGLALALYFGSKLLFPGTTIYRYVSGIVFGIFMAQFIYQMHGMFEMHFWAFIGSILLVNHQNFRLQIPLAVFVVVHHALFAYLQYVGNTEIYFTQQAYMPLDSFIFHAVLATVIFCICGYWAYLNEIKSKVIVDSQFILNKQLETISKNITFADEIAKGNLNIKFEANENDELGIALSRMQENLLKAAQREELEKFINIGLAQSSEILRSSTDATTLTNNILVFLVKYLSANQGALFLYDDNSKTLKLKACYAYDRKKFLDMEINIGEGLVGQAYLEKASIYMTDIPQNYVRITSGLGDSTPNSLLIVPLVFNDEVFGVVELASFYIFEKHKIEFVEKLAENIASTISIAKVNERTQKLLDETQIQAEMLKSQEEEMRQNMEELLANQEEMERKLRKANEE